MLDLTLHAANLILKLPTSVFEGVVDRECQIGMPLVRRRSPRDIDLSAIGKDEMYMDFV
jgi:hypothetical protein